MTAVFAYNRGQLLANCVKSIERFYPDTEVVIFDDRSDDEATRETLSQLRRDGYDVRSPDDIPTGQLFGGLYDNMNSAFELAQSRGRRLLQFVQDDTQFVWRHSELEAEVTSIFEMFPDAAQVQAHFWKQLGMAQGEILANSPAYRVEQFGALGFFEVGRLSRQGFRFPRTEKQTDALAGSLGFAPYALADPVLARIPWPMKAYERKMLGGQKRAGRELLIKPLEPETIARLRGRDREARPRGEYYYVPWGWRCWSPYPISPSYKGWLKSLLVIAIQRRSIKGLVPSRVGDVV